MTKTTLLLALGTLAFTATTGVAGAGYKAPPLTGAERCMRKGGDVGGDKKLFWCCDTNGCWICDSKGCDYEPWYGPGSTGRVDEQGGAPPLQAAPRARQNAPAGGLDLPRSGTAALGQTPLR